MSVILLIFCVGPSLQRAIDAMALVRDSVCVPTYKSQPKILTDFRVKCRPPKKYVLALRTVANRNISDLSANICDSYKKGLAQPVGKPLPDLQGNWMSLQQRMKVKGTLDRRGSLNSKMNISGARLCQATSVVILQKLPRVFE